MEIRFTKGRKDHPLDRIIHVNIDGDEAVTIFRVGLLINQLALNERRVNDYLDWDKHDFFFGEFIKEAVEHGFDEIDWADPEYEDDMRECCKRWQVAEEMIDDELIDKAQLRFMDWENQPENPEPYPTQPDVVEIDNVAGVQTVFDDIDND